MGISRLRNAMLSLSMVAFVAGCGQVDSLLVLNSGSDSAGKSQIAYGGNNSKATPDSVPSGLSKQDDPVVFLESAARFAEKSREYETAAKHWAHLASMDPDNPVYAGRLAASLRVVGRPEDSERVLRQALRDHPDNIDLTEELSKTLIASGRLRDGVVLIEHLVSLPNIDQDRATRLHSAMGVAFDRAEQHHKAQAQYTKALSVSPHNATALNNLGLSYAMAGDLDRSEVTLRKALVSPSAGTQVRQNLAMVLSLKGNTNEARRLVSQDLPPSMVNQTVGFYGGIADQDDAWKDAAAQ